MEEIHFSCVSCGVEFSVPLEYAGHRMECSECGAKQLVPSPAEPFSMVPTPGGDPPPRQPAKRPRERAQSSISVQKKRPPSRRPSPPPTRSRGKGVPIPLIVLAVSGIVIAVVLFVLVKRGGNGKAAVSAAPSAPPPSAPPPLAASNKSKQAKAAVAPSSPVPPRSPRPPRAASSASSMLRRPATPPPPGVVATALGESAEWYPYAVGGNTKFLMDHPFSDKRNVENLRRLGIRTFRYPGGTAGNHWDWIVGTKDKGRFRFPPSDMAVLHKRAGIRTMWMLNMLTETLGNNIKGLKNAERAGAPVRTLELGNEYYLRGNDREYRKRFPTGLDYGAEANEWIRSLRRSFPNARFGVSDTMKAVGVAKSKKGRRRKKKRPKGREDIEDTVAGGWNDQVAAACDEFDAHIIHHYSRAKVAADLQADRPEGRKATPEELRRQWKTFHKPNVIEAFIGRGPDYWAELTKTNDLPRDAKIWVTEFSVNELMGVMSHTWASAMAIANSIATYIDDGRVEIFCYANFLGGWVYKRKTLDLKGLRRQGGNLSTVPGEATPEGKINQFYARAMNGATLKQPIVFENAPKVETGIVRPYASLAGWRFGGKNAPTRAIIVNFSKRGYKIDTRIIGGPEADVAQIACSDPFRLFPREADLPERKLGKLTPTLLLPPYSLTLITGIGGRIPPPPRPSRVVRSIGQDTFVSKKDPKANHCIDTKLLVKGGKDECLAVLRFRLRTPLPFHADSAKLLIHADKLKGTIQLYTAKIPLQSDKITYSNLKGKRTLVGTASKSDKPGWIEFDVSKLVTRPGRYGFILKAKGPRDYAELSSAESPEQPRIAFEKK